MSESLQELEKHLWESADELRANSKLKSSEYSVPVLGLIFLRFADHKFKQAEKELDKKSKGRRQIGKTDFHARGVLYLPENSRYSHLLNLPESTDIGSTINNAMKSIEEENMDLQGVLPRTYKSIDKSILFNLLKTFNKITIEDTEGDAFGKIYEYFLGKFAMSEGQKGGEFFTPTSIVKLIVEIIEPYHGKIFDPACGSGGMFVQSAEFVQRHKKNAANEISLYGIEKVDETVRLCKMNLAVHGLSGDIKNTNSYYDDTFNCVNHFDFVMANPPFNVDKIDKTKLKGDKRFFSEKDEKGQTVSIGLPKADNGNYLWIQIFYNSLNAKGRAGFVMANSASDARQSELEIRKRIIQSGGVDVMISIGSNFFYTVTLPCTLWFFDKGKIKTNRRDKVLFIDARNIFKQIDRAHREFTPSQIEYIANIVRLYREEATEWNSPAEENTHNESSFKKDFPKNKYRDVAGLCKVASLKEIEEQDWSLNPGRYVGVVEKLAETYDFKEKFQSLHEELMKLNKEAHTIELTIDSNAKKLWKV